MKSIAIIAALVVASAATQGDGYQPQPSTCADWTGSCSNNKYRREYIGNPDTVNCGSGYDSCSVVCCAALSNDSGYKPPEKPSYKPPVYEKPSYKPPVVYEKPSYKPPSYEPLAYPAENPVTWTRCKDWEDDCDDGYTQLFTRKRCNEDGDDSYFPLCEDVCCRKKLKPVYKPPVVYEKPSYKPPAYEKPSYKPPVYEKPNYDAPVDGEAGYEPPADEYSGSGGNKY